MTRSRIRGRNWLAVAAHNRSGAGPHRPAREKTACAWCGEDTRGRIGEYCSRQCEKEARDDVEHDDE